MGPLWEIAPWANTLPRSYKHELNVYESWLYKFITPYLMHMEYVFAFQIWKSWWNIYWNSWWRSYKYGNILFSVLLHVCSRVEDPKNNILNNTFPEFGVDDPQSHIRAVPHKKDFLDPPMLDAAKLFQTFWHLSLYKIIMF